MKISISISITVFFLCVAYAVPFFVLGQTYGGVVEYGSSAPKDSDFDGLTDQGEVQIFKTDPTNQDTDNDGYGDGEEIMLGSDPLDYQDPAHFLTTRIDEGVLMEKTIAWPWYIARATGLEAYLLLFLITVLGVGLYTQFIFRVIRSENALVFHKYLSVLVFAVIVTHITALLFDEFIHFRIYETLVPFLSHYQNFSVSLGIIALYLFIIIIATSLFIRNIYPRFWRKLHYLVYPLFVLSLVHGVLIGTDTAMTITQVMYWVTGGIGGGLILYRCAYPYMQKKYSCSITNIFMETKDIVVVELAREDEKEFPVFTPGHYAALQYHDVSGKTTRKHHFSFASSPEHRKVVRFGIKVMGNFTQGLAHMNVGDKIVLQGPYGDFIFKEKKMPRTVFIAGGIGITPFMSALRYALDRGLSNDLTLMYSNRSREVTPFMEEINTIAHHNPRFKQFFSVTDDPDAPEEFLKGRIDDAMLRTCVNNIFQDTYFLVCGSPAFMNATIHALRRCGVSQYYIRKEYFTAY
ncbi:MAG: ferric reductase-like transmembrane domain-containing protein [Candidatus Azambacteria bacterium]|nr:ferric reductase-like transmembrane domain-containing protein [Candidatus Azambacteria bacterium]